jgi:tetratricopeptide (TPR) repeat protein
MTATERKPSQPARFEARAAEQYLTCLAVAGRRKDIETFLSASGDNGDTAGTRYARALALALERKEDEALAELRAAIAAEPKHAEARKLAYRLLVHQAEVAALSQNWQALSTLTTEALALGPEGVDAARDLGRFKNALPIGHLRTGRREEAARLWEVQLEGDPDDVRMLHNLALLHYWGARGIENGAEPPVDEWHAAIACWSALISMDAFWKAWREDKKRSWGFEIGDEDLEAFRAGFLEQQFDQFFQTMADECKQKANAASASAYEDCLTAALLERKSAESWRDARVVLGDAFREGLLAVPGGFLFFRSHGLLPRIAEACGRLERDSKQAQLLANLRIYFSEAGLGTAIVLLQERNKPAEALRLIDTMPEPARGSIEACYVRCLALARQGTNLAAKGQSAKALEAWKAAHEKALESETKRTKPGVDRASVKPSVFDELLSAVRASICEQVVATAQKEAGRLKKEEKLDEAIALLERACEMVKSDGLVEYICICICDRGTVKLGKKNFTAARSDFERALRLKPGFQRAKQGIATTYNNEACEERDHDRSIKLFEKAMEYDPDNHAAKRNLARELRGKAVDLVNAIRPPVAAYELREPISLLERAVQLVGSNLKDGALSHIQLLASIGPEVAKGLLQQIQDDDLKRILDDLITLYGIRKRVQGY